MTDLVKVVNFIRSIGLNHREFKELLDKDSREYEDVVYSANVRWLNLNLKQQSQNISIIVV